MGPIAFHDTMDDAFDLDVYDFDLLKDEEQFFLSSISQREEEDYRDELDSGVGSARSLATVTHRKVIPCLVDHIPDKSFSTTLSENSLELSYLLRNKALDYRGSNHELELNDDILCSHLLDFIDIPGSQSSTSDNPPLFSVLNDDISVSSAYGYPIHDLRRYQQEEQLVNLARPFLTLHNQLSTVDEFFRVQMEMRDLPQFWKVFYHCYEKFTVQYSGVIADWKKEDNLIPCGILMRTENLQEAVEFIYKIIYPLKEANQWKWSEVETAWRFFLLSCTDSEVLTASQMRICAGLQTKLFSLLFSTMDCIYTTTKVPDNVSDHFIMYNDKSESEILVTRLKPNSRISALWDEQLLDTVLRGARWRWRLGRLRKSTSVFSDAINDVLRKMGWTPGEMILTNDLIRAFGLTAKTLTLELSRELSNRLKERHLIDFWIDIKEVIIGMVAHRYCEYLSGTSNSRNEGFRTEQAFTGALAAFPCRTEYAWTVERELAGQYRIICEVPAPLCHSIPGTLLSICWECLEYTRKLFRTHELLISIHVEYPRVEHTFPEVARNRRRVRRVVWYLLNVVSRIKELFDVKVAAVFDTATAALEASDEMDAIERAIIKAERDLKVLVEREGLRGEVHEVVDMYHELADEIRLRTLGGEVEDEVVEQWERKTNRTVEMLTSFGRNMPVESVLHELATQLQFRWDRVLWQRK